jgi:hypothetical protein
MANEIDLYQYIQHSREERYLEYKDSMIWTNDETKVKIAQAMMALSNLNNGGVIIIGLREIQRGVWQEKGLNKQEVSSFTQDDIAQWVNDFAVPAVQFEIKSFEHNNKDFVAILVREFEIIPTICRKPKQLKGVDALKFGAIYYRSNKKNESAPICTEEDMRELTNLAIEKGIARELARLERLKLIAFITKQPEDDMRKYEEERRESL